MSSSNSSRADIVVFILPDFHGQSFQNPAELEVEPVEIPVKPNATQLYRFHRTISVNLGKRFGKNRVERVKYGQNSFTLDGTWSVSGQRSAQACTSVESQ